MACGMYYLKYLVNQDVFRGNTVKVLDIGSQNLLAAPAEDIVEFVENHDPKIKPDELRDLAKSFSERSKFAHPDTTLYLGEVLDLTSIEYLSLDIYHGHRTRILDLNFEAAPAAYLEAFDVVLNFGTTEHIFNQFNSFKMIHDTTKPGGFMFHQVPALGYIDHGYFMYSPRTFTELAQVNGYALLDMWFTGPQGYAKLFDAVAYQPSIRDPKRIDSDATKWEQTTIPNSVINVLFKKEKSAPFRISVDSGSSVGAVADSVTQTYGLPGDGENRAFEEVSGDLRSRQEIQRETVSKLPARVLARELRARIWRSVKRKFE